MFRVDDETVSAREFLNELQIVCDEVEMIDGLLSYVPEMLWDDFLDELNEFIVSIS